jgi:transcriptional regulator with XRE-family HTH domain
MATLRELRSQRLLSIRDLADKSGVAPGTIVRIEAGEPLPRFVTMREIAAALGVEPGDIEEFARAIEARAGGTMAAGDRARRQNARDGGNAGEQEGG